MCRRLGWLVNVGKSELEPKQVFNFVDYQFDLEFGRVRPTPDRWQNLQDKILALIPLPACSVREFMSLIGLLTATEKQVHLGRLHMRPIQWHLKSNWRIPESLEKGIPLPRSLHPHLQWWLKKDNVLTGQPLHPIQHALQIFTDGSKEGRGAHLNEFTARGDWSLPESRLHINYLELKAVLLALKEFQDLCVGKMVLVATDNTTVVAYINKEGYEVRPRSGPLCALLCRILTWCSGKQVTLKARHIPGRLNVVADKLSRLSDHPNRMVPPSGGFSSPVQQVAPTSNRSLCYEIQQQIAPVCITSSGPHGHCSGPTQFVMGESGRVCLPTDSHIRQSSGEVAGLSISKVDHYCPGMAQHDMVLGPSGNVQSDPITLASASKPADPTLQSGPSQESDKPKSPYAWLLEPQLSRSRVSLRWWQQELKLLKEDQPDQSMRLSGPFFTKLCITNQVDFRAPPVKSVADFLMYLFEERKLQPSTIDGYRSAIADKLGSSTLNISKDENLTRLLDSFHRDRPKGRRGIPSWNLWFCTSSQRLHLNQLRRPP